MARPLRLELPGGLYHITSRGDGQEAIVVDDDDRETWLTLLGDVCTRFRWRCHAFCLMTNHYHLLIETPEPNLSRGMRQLNGVYTQRFNRTHGRCGHVFQGRYKAILVERENHFLEVARYVVLNPVRAKMVKEATDWPWSSFRATAGLAPLPPWLYVEAILAQFGEERQQAMRAYAAFVHEGMGLPAPWERLRGQIYLGSEKFVEQMQQKIGRSETTLREIPRSQRQAPPPTLTELAHRFPRDEAMARAYASGAYTLAAIARHFGVHYSTVSRALRRSKQPRKG